MCGPADGILLPLAGDRRLGGPCTLAGTIGKTMSIDFDKRRWDRHRDVYGRWWAGQLDRPVINVSVRTDRPRRPASALPFHPFTSNYPLDVPAEQIVDAWDYQLSGYSYPGDSFPYVWVNFGPGVIAEFLGGVAEPGQDTVWFGPADHRPIEQLELRPRPHSPYLDRILELYRLAGQRWDGLVQVSMTDLGGNLDILSTFREAGQLAMDLYDHPEHVKRLTWEAHEAWFHYFDQMNAVLQPANPGYTTWCPIFASQPWYMLQCDFSYMISPAMFAEFVRPELQASCRRLANSFYHLDGVGQLAHLDLLLEMPELNGIQWVPGAGQPDWRHWPDVFRRIRAAGKLIQVYAWPLETLDVMADQLGSAAGICLVGEVGRKDDDKLMAMLERYGCT